MPLSEAKKPSPAMVRALSGFSLLPCLAIASYRLVFWTTQQRGLVSDTSFLNFLEIASQALTTILLILLERRMRYTERTVSTVVALSTIAQMLGGAAMLAPSLVQGAASYGMLPGAGAVLRGCGSAVFLLGLGRYLCSIEPRKSALYIAMGYTIYGIVALSLSFVSTDVVAFASFVFPVLTCLCLLWSNEKTTFKRAENGRIDGGIVRSLPLDLAFLLLLCALTSIVVGALVPSMRPADGHDAYAILWPIVYLLIFGTYCIWIFRFKHSNVNELWPFLMLIIFSGLLCYSSFSAVNANFAASFLHATQKTLTLFYWVFLTAAIYQYRLPSVLFFGLGNFIFIQAPNLLSHIASALFLPPDVQVATALNVGSIAIVGFVLIGAVVFVLMRRKPLGGTSAHISSENEYARAIAAIAERYALTAREEEVASYAVRGYTFSQIADTLFISADTVRSHSKSLYRKLGVHKKQELIRIVEHAVTEIVSEPLSDRSDKTPARDNS